ncbi:cell division protein FtsL [Nicoliella spurrieriana]|uniref:Cell division protein FtsL n=1 Tax=Nicoliella spurrieriana TaxID=2925830 RepID=A0A976X599_9LACO|nr:cell division protein FtsL [Nicoliella spurrieriana]UQS86431.1 cell division protein FtsL [Nicoliella spurrieriana]
MMEKSVYVQTPDEGLISGGVERNKVRQSRNPNPHKKNGISRMEIFLYISLLVGFIALVLVLISAKVNLSLAQQNLQNVNQKVEKIHNDNSNLKQEVSELQSSSRLQKIAQKNGLSLSNNNIRNVRK